MPGSKKQDPQTLERMNESVCLPHHHQQPEEMFQTKLSSVADNSNDNNRNNDDHNNNNNSNNSPTKMGNLFTFGDEDSDSTATTFAKSDDSVELLLPGQSRINGVAAVIPANSYRNLSTELKIAVQKLQGEINSDLKRGTAIGNLIKLASHRTGEIKDISSILNGLFRTNLTLYSPPEQLNETTALESINHMFFLLFECLFKPERNNSTKNSVLQILCHMTAEEPKIGYLFLFYTYVRNMYPSLGGIDTKPDEKFSVYKDFCHVRPKKFEECLMSDLQLCQLESGHVFLWLIPIIYQIYPRFAINNDQLLLMVVTSVSPIELKDMAFKIVRDELTLIEHDAFASLVNSSLSWESFEQIFFWQLVKAHNISLECMLNSLPKLDFNNDHEAVTCIMLLLKRQKPSANFLKPLFCRDLKPSSDMLVPTILYYWCTNYTEETAEIVSELLISRCPTASPNKRKRVQGQGLGSRTGVPAPSAERILGHLDRISKECESFFKESNIQKALRIAYTACTDTQKQLYSNLFDLLMADEDNDYQSASTIGSLSSSSVASASTTKSGGNVASTTTTSGKGRRRRNTNNNNAVGSSVTVSSTTGRSGRHAVTRSSQKEIDLTADSSDEEVIMKPRANKRKKKIMVVTSDSD